MLSTICGRKRKSVLIFWYVLNSLKENSCMAPLSKAVTFQGGGDSSRSSKTWDQSRADDWKGFKQSFRTSVCQFHLVVQHSYTFQMSQPLMISKSLDRQKSLSRWSGRTHQLRWITSGSLTLTRKGRKRSWTYRWTRRPEPSILLWVSGVNGGINRC